MALDDAFPLTVQDSPAPGSVQSVAAHLAIWCRRSPRGLARVEFTSEFARRRVVQLLRQELEPAGIPFAEIVLPVARPATEVAQGLIERLKSLEAGVVSVSGFETAFPRNANLVDSLRVFNFRREDLARPPHRQVWWLTPSLVDVFLRNIPDLNSWFLVRLQLAESVHPEGRLLPEPAGTFMGRTRLNVEEAREISSDLARRAERATHASFPREQILDELAIPAVEALLDAGLEREARELELRLSEQIGRIPNGASDVGGSGAGSEFPLASPIRRAIERLESAEGHLGPDHPEVAAGLSNVANLYLSQGRYAEAEPMFRRALEILEKALGPEHPVVSIPMENLASLYYNQGRYQQAEPLFRTALEIRKKALPADHPDLAATLENLAQCLDRLGRAPEADEMRSRARAVRALRAPQAD